MRERDLLEHVCRVAGAGPAVPIPPGDDMGMVTVAGQPILAAVDQVVGGRHFDPAATTLADVGRKAICRSLSDVAAMAARPVALLAAATLPDHFEHEQATALFDAMHATARRYGCPLIGGDIAVGPGPLVCSVTVLATPGPAGPIRRGGAVAGDAVYVTGRLGGSLASGRHLHFEPRIDAGLHLAGELRERLHAMIDLSDGLGVDAGRVAAMSGVCIELDASSLPCSPGCGWREAVGDGEDYELCFTATGSVPRRLGDVDVTAVGRVVTARPGEPAVVVLDGGEGGERLDASALGWEHRT